MRSRFVLMAVLICGFILYGTANSGRLTKIEKNIPSDPQVKKVFLHVDIDNAELIFGSHSDADIMKCMVKYNKRKANVDIEYEQGHPSADIFLTQKKKRKRQNNGGDSKWKTSFSSKYDWDMDLDIGYADCNIDLSGLPLTRLVLDIGAADGQMIFDRENPTKMKRLSIDAGAGDFDFIGLGYAGAKVYKFDGGAGDFLLDFSGFTHGVHTADIDIGAGRVTLEIPDDLAVHIEAEDSWLNSIRVKARNLVKLDDGIYESDGYDKAKCKLDITMDIGVGKAIIRQANNIIELSGQVAKVYGLYLGRGEGNCFEMPSIPALPPIPALPAIPSVSALPELPELPAFPFGFAIPEQSGRRNISE